MYNLMVTYGNSLWEEGEYVWTKERVLTYTSEENRKHFGPLTKAEFDILTNLPTLFVYEEESKGVPKTGKITRIDEKGGEIRILFKFDEKQPDLSQERLKKLQLDLEIKDPELNRTHWAVKDVDLYQILFNQIDA